MKVSALCGYCLLHRGYLEILRATEDEKLRFKAVEKLLKLLGENYGPDAVPSLLGTKRDRLIRQVTGCYDPYLDVKQQANEKAVLILRRLEAYVGALPPEERFRNACKIATIGNIIEYDVPGHSHEIDGAIKNLETEGFFIDETDEFREIINPGDEVLLITDNAGEIAFDRLLVSVLKEMGCHVTVAVKGGPSLNDALLEDAEAVGMTEEADQVITTGTDSLGVNPAESSEEFKDTLLNADLLIAKGMANWETITEFPVPCPTLFLFRTKCQPVATSVKAPQNQNIAKSVQRGWHL